MQDARLKTLVASAKKAQADIEQGENWLAEKQRELKNLVEIQIPAVMQELGIEEASLDTGESISVKEQIFANISQERQVAAFQWLRDNGHGGIIKRPEPKDTVHHSTLKALMKELLENGTEVPVELFGVFRQTVAKIS
jgi:hypothetical protein